MIYTTYLTNKKVSDDLKVCIALFYPGTKYKVSPKFRDQRLAPTYEMFKRGYSEAEYIKLIESRGVDASELAKEYDGKYLCCYELDDYNCHRRFLANWLRAKGFEVKEVK